MFEGMICSPKRGELSRSPNCVSDRVSDPLKTVPVTSPLVPSPQDTAAGL